MEFVNCKLCGAEASHLYLRATDRLAPTRTFTIVRCHRCGLLYTNPRPAPGEIGQFYPDAYYAVSPDLKPATADGIGRLARWLSHRRLELEKREKVLPLCRLKGSGRILDVGCHVGLFLRLMREAGWEVYGVEPSATAVRHARETLGLSNIAEGTLEEARFPSGHFDAVTFWEVLEHVHDPKATLREARRVLKEGGVLALSVPNIESWQQHRFGRLWYPLEVPRHLYHFSPSTMRALLKASGFHLLHMSYFSAIHDSHALVESCVLWLRSQRKRGTGNGERGTGSDVVSHPDPRSPVSVPCWKASLLHFYYCYALPLICLVLSPILHFTSTPKGGGHLRVWAVKER